MKNTKTLFSFLLLFIASIPYAQSSYGGCSAGKIKHFDGLSLSKFEEHYNLIRNSSMESTKDGSLCADELIPFHKVTNENYNETTLYGMNIKGKTTERFPENIPYIYQDENYNFNPSGDPRGGVTNLSYHVIAASLSKSKVYGKKVIISIDRDLFPLDTYGLEINKGDGTSTYFTLFPKTIYETTSLAEKIEINYNSYGTKNITIRLLTWNGKYCYGKKVLNGFDIKLKLEVSAENFSDEITLETNPVQDIATFKTMERILSIKIYDYSRTELASIVDSNKIDLSNLSRGNYIYVVTTVNRIKSGHLLKE